VGARVRSRAVLERVEGSKIHCRLEAFNEHEQIGAGHNIQVVLSRPALERRLRAIGALK